MRVIMFKTSNCSSCNRMVPWAIKYMEIIDLEFGENRDYINKFGLHSVPTIIYLDDNNIEVKRHIGVMTEDEFKNTI